MALVISKKPGVYLYTAGDDYYFVETERGSIDKNLFSNIENCEDIVRVEIPNNIVVIYGGAFEDFVNLQEAEISGYVYDVKRSFMDGAIGVNWKNPTVLAESLKSGRYIEIRRDIDWR
jgi:hypothetical protein